ncbi:hypothetical protein BLNAU_1091 [Blattamonas nauphoetae]|uniref:Uncharacterized protein n=1 Tax=Blattamonas nauphoetae TaxID=2049346 RepID=A0ABQ9YK30_9EUKA|nr:hypothetical protein BLNAU_1091 [Blattamonas nauphoetae]
MTNPPESLPAYQKEEEPLPPGPPPIPEAYNPPVESYPAVSAAAEAFPSDMPYLPPDNTVELSVEAAALLVIAAALAEDRPVQEMDVDDSNAKNGKEATQRPRTKKTKNNVKPKIKGGCLQIQEDVTFIPQKHCCGCCARNYHPCSIIWTITFWTWLITILVAFFLFKESLVLVFFVYIGFIYIVNLCLAFKGPDFDMLRFLKYNDDVATHVDRLNNATPQLTFWVECYHYETRTVSDGRGGTDTVTSRVTSFEAECPFRFKSWENSHGDLLEVASKPQLIRVMFMKQYCFGNDETRASYDKQKQEFHDLHRNRDTYMDVGEKFIVPGLYRDELFVKKDGRKPCCFHPCWYGLSAVFTYSTFFRYWMNAKAPQAYFEVIKKLYV